MSSALREPDTALGVTASDIEGEKSANLIEWYETYSQALTEHHNLWGGCAACSPRIIIRNLQNIY